MFNVKVLWLGTYLGESSIGEFESFFKDNLGFTVKYIDEFKLVNGSSCVLFSVADEDIPKFSIFRLGTLDMKWLDDFVENNPGELSEGIIEKYC